MSFTNFRDNFSSGVSFLRRRFSSNDLQADDADADRAKAEADAADTAGFNFNLPRGQRKGPSPSAPSSPSKSAGGHIGSSSGGGGGMFSRGFFSSSSSQQRPAYNKDRCKTLLVIDEPHIDWGKYFHGRKIFGDWDIRVEQAEFSEINLAAYSDTGTVVDIQVSRGGTRVVRSFKPDFVLIRQHGRDAQHDWRNLVIGLYYGGVHSINPLPSVYSFLDKSYVFSQLLQLQQRLGKENFPLIEQSYFPSHRQMLITPRFPVVVKIGHAHSGNGTVKIENQASLQDITSVVAIAGCHCIMEPYIDSKYDLYVQKIGNNYRTFVRTSISGNWKVNTGSSMLEQVSTTDRFRQWVDECSQLFGGLDMVAVQAIVGKDGREHILEINDSSMPLLGETQEEDRKLIADLIVSKMETHCKPGPAQPRVGASSSAFAVNGQPGNVPVTSRPMAGPPGPSPQRSPQQSGKAITVATVHAADVPPPAPSPKADRTADVAAPAAAADGTPVKQPAAAVVAAAAPGTKNPAATKDVEDTDDTMKNLRKTFAGIFGDM